MSQPTVSGFMEKLLDGVEVEWKTLGEACEVFTGGEAPKNSIKGSKPTNDYKYPIYGNGAEIYGYTDTYRVDKDAVTISSIGANTGTIYYREAFFTPIIRLKVLMPKYDWLLSKYIFHYLSSQTIYSKKSSVPNMNAADVKKLQIPIPCPENPKKSLEIQAEIVRILDAFTAMTAELTAELTTRKKQYNYYRDQSLSFEEGEVEWKTLGELVNDKFWIMPATPKFDENENIPYITSKNISGGHIDFNRVKYISRQTHVDLSRNRPIISGDFLISMIGTIGEVARVKETDGDFYGQNMYLIRLNESLIHSGYFLHFFDSPKMKIHFSSVKNNSGQGYLKANNIEDILVPIPSLGEQARITSILDKFDTLTTSITEGLPREIELRKKQYEYYRDLLLSFPKPEEVAA